MSRRKGTHVIRTLRIPSTMDEAIRRLAQERNTSVNALAQASLTRLIEFDQFADELEFVSVRKIFLTKGLDYLTDDEIREFGEWTATESGAEMLEFYHSSSDIDSILHIFETIISKYGKLFTFHHEMEGKVHVVTLNHKMGRKWSLFFDANLRTIFAKVGVDLKTEVRSNVVRGRFVESPT